VPHTGILLHARDHAGCPKRPDTASEAALYSLLGPLTQTPRHLRGHLAGLLRPSHAYHVAAPHQDSAGRPERRGRNLRPRIMRPAQNFYPALMPFAETSSSITWTQSRMLQRCSALQAMRDDRIGSSVSSDPELRPPIAPLARSAHRLRGRLLVSLGLTYAYYIAVTCSGRRGTIDRSRVASAAAPLVPLDVGTPGAPASRPCMH
jgi:hypothetical protein